MLLNKIKGVYRRVSRLYYLSVASVYKIINSKKPKVLVYTDSRGYLINKKSNRFNPFCSYIGYFVKNYRTDYKIVPHEKTTCVDFLSFYKTLNVKYDLIILHVGIVDFSPRHSSGVQLMYKDKFKETIDLFSAEQIESQQSRKSKYMYENEFTNNFYSLEMAAQSIIPALNKIPNLIWIGCNKVKADWRGTYPKKRPDNMFEIEAYAKLFEEKLPNSIGLLQWDEEEIMKYTEDNIHLTREGFDFIYKKLLETINKMKNASS